MTNLLTRLWDDDDGAIVSTELVLVTGILVFGVIAGLVALRNSIIASLGTMGNFLHALTPTVTYSGYAITGANGGGGAGGGSAIAVVNGVLVPFSSTNFLSAQQVAPLSASYLALSPAP